MNLLYTVNPSKRRRRGKRASAHRKHRRRGRSAAQRAATRRMLAARFGTNPVKRSRRRRSSGKSRMRRVRRAASRGLASFRASGVMPVLQKGIIMGAGAVAVDVAMGYASRVLPAGFASPVNTDGSTNWGYIGIKTALALGLGVYGRRIPVVGQYAADAAAGSITVTAYGLIRGLVPASIPLGYYNPAPTQRPLNGLQKYVSAYQQIPVRSEAAAGRGAAAAQVVDIFGRRRSVAR